METTEVSKKPVGFWKIKALAGMVSLSGLVMAVSAETVDINASVGPILDSVISIIPTLINLIVAIVPAVIVLAVVGFIVAFFDRILGMMKL